MKSMKAFELSVFYGLMAIFIGLRMELLVLLLIYLINLRRLVIEEKGKEDKKDLLEKLSGFSNLLEQGYSSIYAYEIMGSFDYPDFMLEPWDENFRLEIFEKQFQLFEKSVLLEEEVGGEILGVKLRASIMKLMPLSLLLFIRNLLPRSGSSLMDNLVIGLFVFNHWLSEKILARL